MAERQTVREKYSSYKDIKVAVYNIMKNEGKFLVGWLENVKDADYIFLLDTGSENGEYEIAKGYADTHPEFKDKLFVEQAIIKPWAFHTARNRNMEMIFDDDKVDVIYSIDLDERVEPGFFDELRKTAWENERASDFTYYYAWSHDPETKRPLRKFGYNKCSFWMKGEIWYDYDVHEALQYSQKYLSFYNSGAAWLNKDITWLHHWPDQTKSRGSYLGLLEQRDVHYPNDVYGKFYLAREYSFVGDWAKCVGTFMRLYNLVSPKNDDMMMLPSICLGIAQALEHSVDKEKEIDFFYQRAIEHDPTFRDAYMYYAKWLGYQGRPVDSLKILQEGELRAKPHYDWREQSAVWEHWFTANIKGVAYCWLGEYDLAYKIMQEAADNMESEYQKKEAGWNNFWNDFEFIKKKVGKI